MKKSIRTLTSNKNQILKSKCSQMKIQQMSFMLLAVALFFILVLLFWMAIQYRSLQKEATDLELNKAIVLAQFLSGSTEFSCVDKQYCIDTDKLIVLNSSSYTDLWPVDYIKVKKIYPSQDKEIVCNIANYPNCNVFDVYRSKKNTGNSSVGSFIALCRHERIEERVKQVCELGRISIGYEVKYK